MAERFFVMARSEGEAIQRRMVATEEGATMLSPSDTEASPPRSPQGDEQGGKAPARRTIPNCAGLYRKSFFFFGDVMRRARHKETWIVFTVALALIGSTLLARVPVALGGAPDARLALDDKKEEKKGVEESQKKDDEKKKAEEKKVTESAKTEPSKTTQPHPALMDPSQATEKAPDQFQAKFETTKGDIVIEVTREWAPLGADRFYNLVKIGYFSDVAFFRVIPDFMAQFG